MPVPNSLPVKLSDVIAEFGGGANAPKNLGAYRAGAGYVPAGAKGGTAAIPVSEGPIPSGYPINLGAFPGAKKELSVTQYWPYKDYYLRNCYYHSSNPPQTVARNDDPTGHWGPDFGNAAYFDSYVLWQQKRFFNATDPSIPDSGQCTVIFLVNNGSFSNTMSQGTGLSVRAADATGVVQHMSPIITGKVNFVTQAGTGTISDMAMSYASYNCSMKKITDVFTAMTDGSYMGTWDTLIILPGLKKIKEAAVSRDNTGYDIKPTNPINPDEVVLGMRYDGSGNYNLQYLNQTFPNWHRMGNWWYNNGCFDVEANVGSSAVALTTTVPQDASPSNVWIVIDDYTGPTYTPGPNPVWQSFTLPRVASNQTSFTVKRNGAITASVNGLSYDLPEFRNTPENWYIGTTLANMPGDSYWVNVSPQASSVGTPNGPTGWTSLSTDRTWDWSGDGTSCIVDISIADNPSGTNPRYLGYIIMGIQASSGGGGGGGSCVEITSYLPDHTQARDVVVGQLMQLADPQTLEASTGIVSYSKTEFEPGWRIETSSGIFLRCSETAPIPTRDNGYKTPKDLKGEFVATRRDTPNGPVVAWEEVMFAYPVGNIAVQHITVGDKNFWAGGDMSGYILHHNIKFEDNPGNENNVAV